MNIYLSASIMILLITIFSNTVHATSELSSSSIKTKKRAIPSLQTEDSSMMPLLPPTTDTLPTTHAFSISSTASSTSEATSSFRKPVSNYLSYEEVLSSYPVYDETITELDAIEDFPDCTEFPSFSVTTSKAKDNQSSETRYANAIEELKAVIAGLESNKKLLIENMKKEKCEPRGLVLARLEDFRKIFNQSKRFLSLYKNNGTINNQFYSNDYRGQIVIMRKILDKEEEQREYDEKTRISWITYKNTKNLIIKIDKNIHNAKETISKIELTLSGENKNQLLDMNEIQKIITQLNLFKHSLRDTID